MRLSTLTVLFIFIFIACGGNSNSQKTLETQDENQLLTDEIETVEEEETTEEAVIEEPEEEVIEPLDCPEGEVPTNDQRICVPRLDFTGPYYHGETLLVSNESTNSGYQLHTGTLPTGTVTRSAKTTVKKEIDPLKIFRIIPLHPDATPELRLNSVDVEPVEYQIGDERMLYRSDIFNNTQEEVTATIQYVGEHCVIWAESTSRVTESKAQQIGEKFDGTVFDLISEVFYHPSDIDNNGKVFIFFANLGGQAGGYFNPNDTFDVDYSNKADIIYIEQRIASYSSEMAAGVVAHEFQHLVHHNRNFLEEESTDFESWIGEGLSTSAEHVYGGVQNDWLNYFNGNDAVAKGQSLYYFDWYNNSDIGANYAQTYMFHQYLRIRAGQGNAIYRELIEDEENLWQAHEKLIQKYIDPEMTLGEFVTQWRLATFLNDKEGIYGYAGEEGFNIIYVGRYNGSGKRIRGGGAVFVTLNNGVFKDPGDGDKAEGIRYVGIIKGDVAPFSSEEYKD